MFSIIICSRKSHIDSKLEANIQQTIGNISFEVVWVDNSECKYSIFQAYNLGVQKAKYPYLCFMHEDVIFHSSDWGKKVCTELENTKLGFIGVVGAYFFDKTSITWNRYSTAYESMHYLQTVEDQLIKGYRRPSDKSTEDLVAVLDGFWLCCRKDLFSVHGVKWDENTFSGFHVYDTDICLQAIKAGFWNKVIDYVEIEHRSCGNFNQAFYDATIRLHKKWNDELPFFAPGIKLPEDYCDTNEAIRIIGILRQENDKLKDRLKELNKPFKQILLNRIKWHIKALNNKFRIPYILDIIRRSLSKSNKIALCCIAKLENDYIREFVEHYHSLGFDNVTIFDNNDPDGERFECILGDYIRSGFCRIIDYRGRTVCQLQAYQEFYDKYNTEYDWIAYFDCDEFMILKKHKCIKDFLSQKKFFFYQQIHINWLNYGDNELLDNDGRLLRDRFAHPIEPFIHMRESPNYENDHIKTITRGGLAGVHFSNPHTCLADAYKCCTATGEETGIGDWWHPHNYEEAYLRHYSTKTIGEWIKTKSKRGYPDSSKETQPYFLNLDSFFRQNKKTPEKQEYANRLLKI